MMRILFNREQVAMGRMFYRQSILVPIDYKAMCYTEFGAIIPIHSATTYFLSVLNKEITIEEFIAGDTAGSLLRISSKGKLSLIDINCAANQLCEYPVTSLKWSTFGFYSEPSKSANAAYDFLLENCKTVESAIQRIEHSSAEGFYDPLILNVQEEAKELTKLGFTKSLNTALLNKVGDLVK